MLGEEKSESTLKIRMPEVWKQKLSKAPFFGWQVGSADVVYALPGFSWVSMCQTT
jgi:hypothetical protein